jgi:hypothetical protein
MDVLNIDEVLEIGGGDISGFGPFPPPQDFSQPNSNLERFIEWKMMNLGYPYDQMVDPPLGIGQ